MTKDAIHVRPYEEKDRKQLEKFRRKYEPADLEIPHGFMMQGENVETVVSFKEGKLLVGSLTGEIAVVCDPAIMNPDATPLEKMQALLKMEEVLTYLGRKIGAVTAYIAIPNELKDSYGKIVEKVGYEETVQNCTVYRRPLVPDTEPLIGPERGDVPK